jgi:hypothetical protein
LGIPLNHVNTKANAQNAQKITMKMSVKIMKYVFKIAATVTQVILKDIPSIKRYYEKEITKLITIKTSCKRVANQQH